MKKWKIILVLCLLVIDVGLLFWLKNIKEKTKISNVCLIELEYFPKDLDEKFDKYKEDGIDGVKSMITSHHFLARDLIAQTFSKIKGNKIEKVIIISPDHFKQIKDKKCLVMTANIEWKNSVGLVKPDSFIINKILENEKYCQNKNSFLGEHGVFTLIPFVQNYIPKAKIIPLILKSDKNYNNFYDLGKIMAEKFSDNKTLLIVSSDFSHYISKDEAKKQDLESIKILKNKEIQNISMIKNDCPQCVAFMFGYLDKTAEFSLVKNTNSFEISGVDPNYVTSYVGGYYK